MNRETKRKIVASNKSAFKDLGAGLKFEASFILHICNLVNEKDKSVTWQDYEHIYNIYIVKWFELCAGNPLLIPDSFEKSYRPDFDSRECSVRGVSRAVCVAVQATIYRRPTMPRAEKELSANQARQRLRHRARCTRYRVRQAVVLSLV